MMLPIHDRAHSVSSEPSVRCGAIEPSSADFFCLFGDFGGIAF
jgi:hypothetical protein